MFAQIVIRYPRWNINGKFRGRIFNTLGLFKQRRIIACPTKVINFYNLNTFSVFM